MFYPKPSSVGWEQATWQGPAEVLSKDERGRREYLGNSIGESEQRGRGREDGYRRPKQRHSPWRRMEVP